MEKVIELFTLLNNVINCEDDICLFNSGSPGPKCMNYRLALEELEKVAPVFTRQVLEKMGPQLSWSQRQEGWRLDLNGFKKSWPQQAAELQIMLITGL